MADLADGKRHASARSVLFAVSHSACSLKLACQSLHAE